MELDEQARGRLEEELARIRNVGFVQLVQDDKGQLVNIDVVSDLQRSPQRIVRDIEIVLRRHGLDVDRRIIGVVQMESADELRERTRPATNPAPSPAQDPSPAPAPETRLPGSLEPVPAVLELVPELDRIRLVAVHSSRRGAAVQVEVELAVAGREGSPGLAEGPGGGDGAEASLVAEATLAAVRNLLHPGYEARLRETRVVEMGDEALVACVVEFGRGRQVQSLAGACLQRGSLYDAAVYAVLDALNRPLGRARFRAAVVGEDERDEDGRDFRAASA